MAVFQNKNIPNRPTVATGSNRVQEGSTETSRWRRAEEGGGAGSIAGGSWEDTGVCNSARFKRRTVGPCETPPRKRPKLQRTGGEAGVPVVEGPLSEQIKTLGTN